MTKIDEHNEHRWIFFKLGVVETILLLSHSESSFTNSITHKTILVSVIMIACDRIT